MMERRNFLKSTLVATGSLSPLYFRTVTARLKAFIERLYAISVDDTSPSKDTVLLMTAGDDKDTTFEQPLHYFWLISQVLGENEKGVYLAGGCTGCGKPAREISKEHLEDTFILFEKVCYGSCFPEALYAFPH